MRQDHHSGLLTAVADINKTHISPSVMVHHVDRLANGKTVEFVVRPCVEVTDVSLRSLFHSGVLFGSARLRTVCAYEYDRVVEPTPTQRSVCSMDELSPAERRFLGPAILADADVRAVLSALGGLSTVAEVPAAPLDLPRGERYTRVRLHGRGGLGQVWLGRDELVGRIVAIKEPRTDRPGTAARAALEREAWVLGQLQHPNIVPLFDLAREPKGQAAFYVMPFLGGDTLHDLAARFHVSRPPGPVTRLTLLPLLTAFLDVCAAIDHAHARGVWHLDIKGDNIKLGPTGAAVVLDWGLARLAEPVAGEPPAGTGAAGGTPAFMAPEQAESSAERVGRHTDVYGLGALLYLILTGQPPRPEANGCDRDTLRAALRRPVTSPHAVWPGVPAALAAVCQKALALEPADRYGSAAELRDEVRRWLADEAVAAHREPLAARLARWGRRHRRVATGAAAVLATAVLALAVGLLAVNRERQKTDRHRRAAEAALALERDSFRQAVKAGDDYFTAVSDSPLLKAPGQQPLRRELLQRGLAYYQDFLSRRGSEPALRAEVAAAWFRVGQTQVEIGTLAQSADAYDRAVTLGEELLAAQPEIADLRAQLARWCVSSAWALRLAGRYADALGRVDRTAALAIGLPEGHPQRAYMIARALDTRGAVLALLGDLAGARLAAEQADTWYAHAEHDPPTRLARGLNLSFLGQALRELKRPAEAADAFQKARGLFEALYDQPGWALTARQRIGGCDNALGLTSSDAGDHGRAMAYFEAAHATRKRLVEESPTVHTYRAELATTCLNLALEHREHGDARRAAGLSRQACAHTEELVGRDPADFYFRSLAIRAHRLAAGDAEAHRDMSAEARLRIRSGELLAGFASPVDRAAWQGLARDAVKDGLRQLRWGHWRSAAESFRQALVGQHQASEPAQPPDQRASAARQ
jgi:tetratricopeptide (TPR) repeat protein